MLRPYIAATLCPYIATTFHYCLRQSNTAGVNQ